MDAIQAIVDALNLTNRSMEQEIAPELADAYATLRAYLQERYPTLTAGEAGLTAWQADQIDVAHALRRIHAQDDPRLINHVANVLQQVEQLPEQTLDQLGVSLENVRANSIVIKDVTVNRLPEPEPIRQMTIVAYLHALTNMEVSKPSEGEDPGISDVRRRLEATPFFVHDPSDVTDERRDIVRAIDESFQLDVKLERIQRVVVLAESGVGKTKALKYVRQRVARENLAALAERTAAADGAELDYAAFAECLTLPIYINLEELLPGLPLERVLLDEFNRQLGGSEFSLEGEQVPDVLKKHVCLFLLDGLDTIVARPGLLQELRRFMDENRNEKFVISCRTVNYRTQLGSIDTLLLDDLSRVEALSILGQERYQSLYASLGPLTHNRMMLQMVLNVGEIAGGTAQFNKGQLVRTYTKEWIRAGLDEINASEIERELVEATLEHLAYCMYRDHTYSYSERATMRTLDEFLAEWSEGAQWRNIFLMLRRLQFIVQDERGYWSFSDRTISAYLAAAAMLREQERLPSVLAEVSDLWWREVFEILTGLVHDPTDFFFDLMDRDVLLAAYCARYRNLAAPVIDALIDTLIARLAYEDLATREQIAMRLGESEHPRAADALLRALQQETTPRGVFAIACATWDWARTSSFEALEAAEARVKKSLPQRYESCTDLLLIYELLVVCRGALRAKHEAHFKRILADTSVSRLRRGLSTIGLGFSPSDDAHDTLLALVQDDAIDPFVAWCATNALTQSRRPETEPQTIKIYTQTHDTNHPGRVRAIYLLGWNARTKKAREILRDRALQDENAAVRAHAVEALLRLDLPETRQVIEQTLLDETDPEVIRRCAEALAVVGTAASLPALIRHRHIAQAHTRWKINEALRGIEQRHKAVQVDVKPAGKLFS